MSKHSMERFFKKHIALVSLVGGAAVIAGLLLTQTNISSLIKSQVIAEPLSDFPFVPYYNGSTANQPQNVGTQAQAAPVQEVFLWVKNFTTLKNLEGKSIAKSMGKITGGKLLNCVNGPDGKDIEKKGESICTYLGKLEYPFEISFKAEPNITDGWMFDRWDTNPSGLTCNKSVVPSCTVKFSGQEKENISVTALYKHSIVHQVIMSLVFREQGFLKITVSKGGKVEKPEKAYEQGDFSFALEDGYEINAIAEDKTKYKFEEWHDGGGKFCPCKGSKDRVCKYTVSRDTSCFATYEYIGV